MKNGWWKDISKVQNTSDKLDFKTLYSFLPEAFGPQSSPVVPLKSKDDQTTIKDPVRLTQRWNEHFPNLFFNPSVVNDSIIKNLPLWDTPHQMDRLPTRNEVDLAIKQINTGKAPGFDGIPVELLRNRGGNIVSAIHNFITDSRNGTPIPQDWMDGILVSLYKGKGFKSVCDSYRGTTLLETVCKVFGRLLLNRLMEDVFPLIVTET